MINEDSSVKIGLLSSEKMDITNNSVKFENETEKGQAEDGREPDLRLHDAVSGDDLDEVQELVDGEPHLIFETDLEGLTPLHSVVINNGEDSGVDIAKILLGVEESADKGVKFSIERPQLLNVQDIRGYTALHYAAINRQVEMIEPLLRWGADPMVKDNCGNTPLHWAAKGLVEKAQDCVRALLKADTKRVLINSVNNEEKTPLHLAIDVEAVNVTKELLKPDYRLDLAKKDSQGKNVLHYICSGEERERTGEILEAILTRAGPNQINQPDDKQRTPLHLAAIQRLPQLTKILVNEVKTDVFAVDSSKKTALHYACQHGLYPKGRQCVEVLIRRKMEQKIDLKKFLYLMEDVYGQTPLMYACINCPTQTLQSYLGVLDNPAHWLTGTYISLLYKHNPQALKVLMDRAFSEGKGRDPDKDLGVLNVDYGSVIGYTDTVEKENRQETKYLKQILSWKFDTQKAVLLHPLVQLFVLRKWQKLIWIIYLWIAWQLVWLVAFTVLIENRYTGVTNSNPVACTVASFIMIVYILTSFVTEAFEMSTVKLYYLTSLTNMGQLAQNVLALVAIYPVFFGTQDEDETRNQKLAAAIGILIAYILTMKDIGKLHERIGQDVETLKSVIFIIVRVLLFCSPLIIGFAEAFRVILENEESLKGTFPAPLVKVFVMMTGEFEFNDTFKEDEADVADEWISRKTISLYLFFTFVVMVPVAFFNLLTGIALEKVSEIRERAKVGRIVKQLEHIYIIESIFLAFRPLKKVSPQTCIIPLNRRFNVGSRFSEKEQTWKFSPTISERISDAGRSAVLGGRKGFERFNPASYISAICPTKLPEDIQEDVYKMALETSKGSSSSKSCWACKK